MNSKPPWRAFAECLECGHANWLSGCECENPRCICLKRNKNRWNGLGQVNGGPGLWVPRD